jgi:hypothetical protein
MVLRRIFWPKKEKVTRGWRKLNNEELHNLYSQFTMISERIRELRNSSKVVVGKPEEKKPLGRPRHRWAGQIKIYFK